jgi:hypothetical protein
MPSYTLINTKTEEVKNIVCSHEELNNILAADPSMKQKLCAPRIVSQAGSLLSKTPDSWNDLLGQVKKGSGYGNTIHVK